MAVGGVAADVIADGSGFGASLRRVLARHQNESVDVDVNVDTRRANQQLGAVERRLRSLRSAAAGAARVGAIATAISFLGAASAVAAGQLVAVTAALAPMVGILATLPAAFGVAVAGVATLVVALQGMGDAFSAALGDDVEAFEESLEGLAPAAADTARALREVAPAWRTLRESVQGAFFEGIADSLRDVSDALVGPMQAGMTRAATSLNGLVRGFADVITSAQGVQFVEGTFATLSTLIDNTSGPLNNLVAAFIAVGNAINTAFGPEAGSGLGDMIQRFADFLNAAAESGRAVSWVEGAMEAFSLLGAVLGPIASILGTIGSAAAETGSNLLGAFGAALSALDDFLASAQGTEFLAALFATLGELGAALGPIFGALGSALTPLLGVAGTLVTTLAPAVTTLIGALGEGLAAIAPAIGPLASAIAGIVTAIAPLLPALGQIIGLVATFAADLLSALLPVFTALMPVITAVADILTTALAPVFAVLTDVIATLAPYLGEIVGLIADAFLPLLEQWAEVLADLMPPLGELAITLVDALMPIIIELLPVVLDLATLFQETLLDAVVALMPLIVSLVEVIAEILIVVTPVISAVATFVGWLAGGLVGAISAVIGWISDLVGWFADIGSTVADAIGTAIGWIGDFASEVGSAFADIGQWIDDVVGWFTELPGRILGAIGDLGSQIWDSIVGGIGDLGDFLGFANGGIITSPTVAALAEDGRPEVVIPLTKPARAQQLAQESGLTQILNVGASEPRSPVNVTINVNGGDLREVRRTIEDVMAEYA